MPDEERGPGAGDGPEETRRLLNGDETVTAGPPATAPFVSIGPYRLLQRIGEGGMGEVWEAEQTEPIHRRVALKLIKHGMDSSLVTARFEVERQALALMDHPGIARVIEAGATEQGRPYFVMDYVPGVAITEYCDKNRLSTRERLELFVQVCDAVQHAHQKAIIHRDLKPSNVLVAVRDGKAMPKVIDFGVAKATAQRLTERTLYTELGMMVGTPGYMSPEQAGMTVEDIDTRADVYSLGVILYELLIGVPPLDVRELRRAGLEEMLRKIREEEPSKPSTRISGLGEASAETARVRHTDLRSLARQLRGDLDWITMRALEKDRARRYGSPAELAADIGRHLHHEPVLASPPSPAYRLGKFVQRHKVLAGSLVSTGAVLVLAAVVSAIFGLREAEQRREAEQARADLETVVAFQANMLAEMDPEGMGRRLVENLRRRIGDLRKSLGEGQEEVATVLASFDSTVYGISTTDLALEAIDREILSRAAQTIETEFQEQPMTEARLRSTIGETYRELGMYDLAEPHLQAALAARMHLLGEEHPETLESRNDVGALLYSRGEFGRAEQHLSEAVEGRRRILGTSHPDTLRSIDHMGLLTTAQGKLEEAETYLREALAERRRVLGNDHPDTLHSINNVGFLHHAHQEYEQAEPYLREALEGRRRVLGNDHVDTLTSINNLGFLLKEQGKFEEAEPYLLEALAARRRILGNNHSDTLHSINNMGVLRISQGNTEAAERYWTEALQTSRRILGDNHPDTMNSINNMGFLLYTLGRLEESELYLREVLERRRNALGDDHPVTLDSISNLGGLLKARGELAEAEQHLRAALEGRRRTLGDEHRATLISINNLGGVMLAQERYEEAEAYFREALQGSRRVLGEGNPNSLKIMAHLAQLCRQQGREGEAKEIEGQMARIKQQSGKE